MPDEKIIRVITDTDAKNEADDQFAIVHTMLSPKFDNIGFIAAHFGKRRTDSMERSYKELENIFDLMNFDKTGMIYRGAPYALEDENTPIISEGAKLIVEEAMKDDPRPLYVTFLGALTDLASAYLMEPRIADRLTAIWIGGGNYPNGRSEFNLGNDKIAANIVMKSNLKLWQVPKDMYELMPVSSAELELRVRPCGKIGKYLCDQLEEVLFRSLHSDFRSGEVWVLGDSPVVGLMLYEHRFHFDMIPAPEIDMETGCYIHTGRNRPIRVYNFIDARLILEDMFCKLRLFAENNGTYDPKQ